MDIINLWFDTWYKLVLEINWLVLAITVIIIFAVRYFVFGKILNNSFDIDETEIGIGNNKIKIKPNFGDYQIAYQIWVELSTRKIGLPIDFENDVIEEIYDSWYEFFKITRELIKEIPIRKYQQSKSTQELVRIAVEVLNEEMRPHLTKWQAKYRKWVSIQNDKSPEKSPQDIQKEFPEYDQLVEEMKTVNQSLINYRVMMRDLITK